MKRSIVIFGILFLMIFGLKNYSASLFFVKKYHCIQTGSLSDDYFTSIKTCVHTLLDNKYSAHALIAHLKKEYPLVGKINIAYRPCGTYVMMHARKPLCCINDNLVFATDHQLYPQDYFATDSLNSIAHIAVAQDYVPKITTLAPLLLRDLPSDFYETYNLNLINEHCVHLTDKQDHNFTIISSVTQKELSTLLMHCSAVKKTIRERKYFNKAAWIADTRFSDYIIAYKV